MICWVPKPLGALPLRLWQPQHMQLVSQAQFGSHSTPAAVLGDPPTVLASPLCCNFIAISLQLSHSFTNGLPWFHTVSRLWCSPGPFQSCSFHVAQTSILWDTYILSSSVASLRCSPDTSGSQFLCSGLEEILQKISPQ